MFKAYILLVFFLSVICHEAGAVEYEKRIVSIEEVSKVSYVRIHSSHEMQVPIFPYSESCVFDKCEFEKEFQTIPETFVAEIKDAKIFGKFGYISLERNNPLFIRELIWPWDDSEKEILRINFSSLPPFQKTKSRIAVLAQKGASNYYHWMTEVLPKMQLLKESKVDFDLVYVPYWAPFQKESLDQSGISEDKVIFANDKQFLESNTVIIPSFPSNSQFSPDWVLRFLRETFLENCLLTQERPKKRIFLSRKNSPSRLVSNEEELSKLLKERYEISTVVLDGLSIKEQAKLFSEAELIVAPHGAALTNIVFARPETAVVELFSYRLDQTFFKLSHQLQLKYIPVIALPTEEKKKLFEDRAFYKKMQGQEGFINGRFDVDLILSTLDSLLPGNS